MKNHFLLFYFLFFWLSSFGQHAISLKLHDGIQKKGVYWYNNFRFKDQTTKEKIKLKDVAELVIYHEDKAMHFYVLRIGKIIHGMSGMELGFGTKVITNAK